MQVMGVAAGIRRQRGFTLVELLVVIGIIVILMGLLTPAISIARRHALSKDVRNQIRNIEVALSSLQLDRGDYPDTDWEIQHELHGNGINTGNENLVAQLTSLRGGGPLLEVKEDQLDNTDADSSAELRAIENWVFGDDELREFVDVWGNPYVYIHSRDYELAFDVYDENRPKKISVKGCYSEDLNTFHHLTGFQIWSFGADGANHNGDIDSDDVASWR